MKSHKKETWAEVYEAAVELEIIQTDNNPVKKTILVAAVETAATDLEFNPEELKAINAIRVQKGWPTFQLWTATTLDTCKKNATRVRLLGPPWWMPKENPVSQESLL